MGKQNPHKVGLVLGAFAGLWHLLWSVLVSIGWAEPLLNFGFRMHFIEPVYRVSAFDIGRAAVLVIIAAALGYAVGFVVSHIWNTVHR